MNTKNGHRIPQYVTTVSSYGTTEEELREVVYSVGFLVGQALAEWWPNFDYKRGEGSAET